MRLFGSLFQNSVTKRKFRKYYFADHPVDLSKLTEFRGDAFPVSGPASWLDQPDSLLEVERKLREGIITEVQAEMCRRWIFNGYIIEKGLISDVEIDEAWSAYEKAINDGLIS